MTQEDIASTQPPPHSLGELRGLVARYQSGKAKSKIGGRALKALVGIVESPNQTAICSISEVAATAGVNASTLSRLARKLGYRGFNEFQDVFRREIAVGRGTHGGQSSRPPPKGEVKTSGSPLTERISDEEVVNIAETTRRLDRDQLASAADALIHARRVRVFGARQMHAVACMLSYGLGMLRSDVALLGTSDQGMAHGLAQHDEGDVLVIMGCAPYTRATIDTARIAADRGMHVIALINSADSTLSPLARELFVCETNGSFFGTGTAAMVVTVEVLLTIAGERLGTRTVQQLLRREALINQLAVEL